MSVMSGEVEHKEETLREMLTIDQVIAKVPISRSTLFRMEKDKLFPQGQSVTPHKKLWFADEIRAWQRDLQDPNSEVSKAVRARPKKSPRRGND